MKRLEWGLMVSCPGQGASSGPTTQDCDAGLHLT